MVSGLNHEKNLRVTVGFLMIAAATPTATAADNETGIDITGVAATALSAAKTASQRTGISE